MNFKEYSILKSPVFWIIFIAFITAILIIFASPYLFESLNSLVLRLFIGFGVFFTTIISILLYTLFVKDEFKEKLRNLKEQMKKKQEYSDIAKEKVEDLKIRFNEAMRILKDSSIYKNKQTVGYELPWYLMVGLGKEGKTSILDNSGLDFPLNINYDQNEEDEESQKTFQWYFAEHAIFIDMPGRYISKNRTEDDLILWESFLKLFGRKRWKRPINGIILTISVDTLMNKNENELEQYAKDLRDRFDEISHAFVSNIPIYLLISKSDGIVGFKEYFSDISDDEKAEVLGVTFDEEQVNIDNSVVKPELESLLLRLNSSIFDKLNREWDTGAKSKILLFSHELSSVFERLNMFVDMGFAQTRYRKPLMLRGIYFTSVANENELLSSQEFEQNTLSSLKAGKGMFIQKILSDVIFPEADIIKMDTNYKKNQRIKHIGTFISSILIVAISIVYWTQDFNSRLISLDESEKNMIRYNKERILILNQTNFENILLALNKIHAIHINNNDYMENEIWKVAYFKVADRNMLIKNHYKESLENILLPLVADFMEEQIKVNIGDYDLTWDSTKAYTMLNNEERRDNAFLKEWMASVWSHLYPNMNEVQNELNLHFANLLEYGFSPYPLRKETLLLSKKHLLEFGQEALIYKELKNKAKEKNLRNFRFSESLGSYASAFQGSDYIIPGFFTKKGFENFMITDGKGLIKELVANNWVVGYSSELTDIELDEMYEKVQNYYFIDYKKHWATALSSLKIPNYKSISEINNQMTVLTSGTSPIIGVLHALKENTLIYTPAEKLQIKANTNIKGGTAISVTSRNAIEKAKKITKNTNIRNIREYFSVYNNLLGKDNKPTAKLETGLSKLNTVYQEMTAIYGSVTPEKDAYTIVTDRVLGRHEPIVMQVSALPRPIDKWFKSALKNDWEYLLSRTRKYINSKYTEDVLGYYNDKIKGRYPIRKDSRRADIRIQDFEEFFRKDGIVDTFYENYVSAFVKINVRRGTYQYLTIDGSNMNISEDFMKAMLNAKAIKNMLFTRDENILNTSFYFKPNSLGRKLSRMEIFYNKEAISYEHGPIQPQKIIWPDESLSNKARFGLFDLQKNSLVRISGKGEWAFFRLIDKLNIKSYKQRKNLDLIIIEYNKNRNNSSFILTGKGVKVFTKDSPLTKFKLNNEGL